MIRTKIPKYKQIRAFGYPHLLRRTFPVLSLAPRPLIVTEEFNAERNQKQL